MKMGETNERKKEKTRKGACLHKTKWFLVFDYFWKTIGSFS